MQSFVGKYNIHYKHTVLMTDFPFRGRCVHGITILGVSRNALISTHFFYLAFRQYILSSSLRIMKKLLHFTLSFVFLYCLPPTVLGQVFDSTLVSAVKYRSIGPYRGGRSAAVTGVAGKPDLYYFGATGGGVWRTKDGGSTWGKYF